MSLNDGGLIPNSNTAFEDFEMLDVSLYEKKNTVQGKIFVRNNYHNKVENIVDSLSSVFIKYPKDLVEEVESKSVKFFVIDNIFIVETENYVVSDAYSYDITTNNFKNTNTKAFFIKKGETNKYLDVFVNSWYDEQTERIFLVFLKTELNSLSSSNYKQVVPQIYSTSVKKLDYRKIYPLKDTDTSVYSLSTNIGDLPEINLREYVGGSFKKNPIFNEYNLTYMARNLNSLPFIVTEKLYFQVENNTFLSQNPILLKPFYYIIDNNYSNPELQYYVRGVSNISGFLGGKREEYLEVVEGVRENINYVFASDSEILQINETGKYVIQFDWKSYDNVTFFVGCSSINVREINDNLLLDFKSNLTYLSAWNETKKIFDMYLFGEKVNVNATRPTYPDNEILVLDIFEKNKKPFDIKFWDESIYNSVKIIKTGSGDGLVYTNPESCIYCGDSCEFTYPLGETVTLVVSSGYRSIFTGWSGDTNCSGTDGDCTFTVDGGKTIYADFFKVTPTPTPTQTPTPTPTPTNTETPTQTPTPTNTPTNTQTPTSTQIYTPTPTPTNTSTPTNTPSITPTPTFVGLITFVNSDPMVRFGNGDGLFKFT
jgi:hypothetical protein